ncbi:MAG: thioredoxin-disulfide reductase, partial [Candidatus Woesearchaeota archaeon]
MVYSIGEHMEQVIIIGSGPAGLTAAIYTARANLQPLMFEGVQQGGQLMLTTDVENFPGFPTGVTGPQLIADMRAQAERFGTRFVQQNVSKVEQKEHHFLVHVQDKVYETKTIIISTGAASKWLDIPSEQTYKGKGVTTCATCDGAFYKGLEVVVVGGGDSACEEALFLTKFATKVTLIHRRDELRASKIMQDRVKQHPKIEIAWNKVIVEVKGDGQVVQGVVLEDTQTKQKTDFKTDGVFVAIGHTPNTSIFKGLLAMDSTGYLKTDGHTKTNIAGIFACGDVQDTIYR